MTTIDEVYIRLNKMRDTVNEAELGENIGTAAENFAKLKRELIGQLYDTVKIVSKAMNRRIEKTDPEYIELLESQVAAQKVLLEEARKGGCIQNIESRGAIPGFFVSYWCLVFMIRHKKL